MYYCPNYYQVSVYQTNPYAVLPLIKEALKDEKSDARFYEWLIKQAPEEDRKIIEGIRNDEKKHAKLFKLIYRTLTGQEIEGNPAETFEPPSSYVQALAMAVSGESGAVELYRKIYFAVPGEVFKNMLFEIMTDELKHGIRYSFLYSKNK